jgi:hypothetical protein
MDRWMTPKRICCRTRHQGVSSCRGAEPISGKSTGSTLTKVSLSPLDRTLMTPLLPLCLIRVMSGTPSDTLRQRWPRSSVKPLLSAITRILKVPPSRRKPPSRQTKTSSMITRSSSCQNRRLSQEAHTRTISTPTLTIWTTKTRPHLAGSRPYLFSHGPHRRPP